KTRAAWGTLPHGFEAQRRQNAASTEQYVRSRETQIVEGNTSPRPQCQPPSRADLACGFHPLIDSQERRGFDRCGSVREDIDDDVKQADSHRIFNSESLHCEIQNHFGVFRVADFIRHTTRLSGWIIRRGARATQEIRKPAEGASPLRATVRVTGAAATASA